MGETQPISDIILEEKKVILKKAMKKALAKMTIGLLQLFLKVIMTEWLFNACITGIFGLDAINMTQALGLVVFTNIITTKYAEPKI